MANQFPYKGDVGEHSYLAIEALIKNQSQFSGIRATSDFRPGSITISGNVSYHARGNAVDFIGSKADMIALAKWIRQYFAPYTMELIHSPEGGINVHNGVTPYKYDAAVTQEHFNHVHWAITNSGLKAGGAGTSGNGSFVPTALTLAGDAAKKGPPKVGCLVPTVITASLIGAALWETIPVTARLVSAFL